eukprot:TRINITY_DN67620_c0_g1_i1.p1 TRINITY_DN67620_c0_g1~~TRINITY_DN67620_c0_g1_i1.p1  ORF type:complete len:602 (-),score=104.25 TRINITY_DN67620_c0_g1_i1:33-1670(-)
MEGEILNAPNGESKSSFKKSCLSDASFEDLLDALMCQHSLTLTKMKELSERCDQGRCAPTQDDICCDDGGPSTVAVLDKETSDVKSFKSGPSSHFSSSNGTHVDDGYAPRRTAVPLSRTSMIHRKGIVMCSLDSTIEEPPGADRMRTYFHSAFTSKQFEEVLAVVALIDLVLVGLEADARIFGNVSRTQLLLALSIPAKFVFFVDLMTRFYTYGASIFIVGGLVKLESLIVFSSMLDILLTNILHVGVANLAGALNIPRVFRLIRIARAGRLYPKIRPLWVLLSGLRASLLTMMWAAVLIFVLSYGFAIVGVEMIPPSNRVVSSAYDEKALEAFDTIHSSIVSLFQIITFDDAASVYQPLMKLGNSRVFCSLYFGCFIMLVSIAFMNLVTAIVVEESLEQAQQNKEMVKELEMQRQQALIPRLRQMFALIDRDGSGEVSWEEIQQCPIDMQEELKNMTKADDLLEIFQLLDDDDSGTVLIDEFLDGILKGLKSTSGDVMLNLLIRKLMRQVMSIKKLARGNEPQAGDKGRKGSVGSAISSVGESL